MCIYKIVNKDDFIKGFEQAGLKKEFSLAALSLMFDSLTKESRETGNPTHLDPIFLATKFKEWGSLWELADEFGYNKRSECGRYEIFDEEEAKSILADKGVLYMSNDVILFKAY